MNFHEICCGGQPRLHLIATALVFAPLVSLQVMAQRATLGPDQLSNKSPAKQEREKHIKRKTAPQNPPPQGIAGGPVNDDCQNAIDIQTLNTSFSTVGATTDGPPHPICLAFGDDQVNQDIWFNYTASKDDLLNISLCLSGYDTRIAVYEGCECPVSDANILMCNDDSCGLQSQLTGLPVIEGHCYKIRVGGYDMGAGEGTLMFSISGDRLCAGGNHDCCVTGTPGCNDLSCCEVVCSQDAFCCDVEWDLMCVQLADKTCAKPCPSPCSKVNPHDCFTTGGPGCNDVRCCEAACALDPFCCDTAWDEVCVSHMILGLCDPPPCPVVCTPGALIEEERCGEDNNGSCGGGIGACQGPFPDCCEATGLAGCSDPICQQSICANESLLLRYLVGWPVRRGSVRRPQLPM
jgi:hypothetical protein